MAVCKRINVPVSEEDLKEIMSKSVDYRIQLWNLNALFLEFIVYVYVRTYVSEEIGQRMGVWNDSQKDT